MSLLIRYIITILKQSGYFSENLNFFFFYLPTLSDFYLQVGQFQQGQLKLQRDKIKMYSPARTTELFARVHSVCPEGNCDLVYCQKTHAPVTVLYQPGDIILGGLFSVHRAGTGKKMCGSVDTIGAQNLESYRYAIKRINEGKFPEILNGVKLGALGFDDCSNPSFSASLINGFHGGSLPFVGADGEAVGNPQVDAYQSSTYSSNTVAAGKVLTELDMPLIAGSATSTELSDSQRFPYFLRTIPGDDRQVQAMVQLMKQLGWSYVQTIQSADTYGRNGIEEFQRVAEMEGICLAAKYELNTHGTVSEIAQKLRSKPNAKLVIIFISDYEDVRKIVTSLHESSQPGEFLLLGSDGWSNIESVVKNHETFADGSITVSVMSHNSSGFGTYIESLRPTTNEENPWFKEYYEELFDCSLDEGPSNSLRSKCPTPYQPIHNSQKYAVGPFNIHYINAVYASALGIDAALKHYCGEGYRGVCQEFRNAPDKTNILLQKIQSSTFKDDTGQQFEFNNREGSADYVVYNYQGKEKGYVQVSKISI